LATDALMGFALGSILTFRGELWMRARAILRQGWSEPFAWAMGSRRARGGAHVRAR
jgi:hypothetical protein